MINITSTVVVLNNLSNMGKGYLNNITIIGSSNITVACNNSGILRCSHCSNIFIEGITWDQCGNPNHPYFISALGFQHTTNISISKCIFKRSRVCLCVGIVLSSGFVQVQDSRFLFNYITNSTKCTSIANLAIMDSMYETMQTVSVNITGTLFNYNGVLDYGEQYNANISGTLFCTSFSQRSAKYHIENSLVNNTVGLGSNFFCYDTIHVTIHFTNVTFFNNSKGGSLVNILGESTDVTTPPYSEAFILIKSCSYAHNINGSLKLLIRTRINHVLLYGLTIVGNKGTFANEGIKGMIIGSNQGAGILIWSFCVNFNIKIIHCNIHGNSGGKSILYILTNNHIPYTLNFDDHENQISLASSNITDNVGSAIFLSQCTLRLIDHVLFMNNSAESGAAIHLGQNSKVVIKEHSTIDFIRNTALKQGGAIYVEYSFICPQHGIVFNDSSSDTSTVSFTNNSAGIAGNSIYFNIPASCDVVQDSMDNNSLVYIPYKFNYTQLPGSIWPPIITSPYKISLCSKACPPSDNASSGCYVPRRIMLGQSVDINAVVCDYYGNVSETVQFLIECTNCNNKYRLSSNKILVHYGVFIVKFLAVDADRDIVGNTNITLKLSSVLPSKYRQLTGTVSLELSSCQSGYAFDTNLQQCECYEQSEDIIQCQQDYAEIKYGYWFGIAVFPKRTVSSCPIHYCEYDNHAETTNGYYRLPEELDDQCYSHRTGVACGECKSEFTLAYDSPDCINTDKCSAGMTVLVLVLTVLYWIIVVTLVFGLMQLKISLGYVYGLIYYYSIIDILMGSNLFISNGVFQLVTILSSFAKLTPQFLGKLCFIQDLSGIDQQFIHYFHAMSIFLLIGGIVITTRHSFKIASIVSRCIIHVLCLLILLSYTSLASTSLQLLRPLHFDDVDGVYVYSSPSIKYFAGRHIPYGIIALLCELFIVIGLPLLLLLEPILQRKFNFIKIKPLIDQFQECYKDQYHWFAAYYLICRQVIIAIVYISNFNNSLYYLQTACIIIVTIHVWIKPYKSDTLNRLDGEILLTMVLIVNLNTFTLSISSTTLIVVLPLFISSCTFIKSCCTSICKNIKKADRPEEVLHG